MITSILSAMVPILLAALGGTLTERAGVLNIGIEGLILTGAFFSVVAVSATGSMVAGLFAGAAAGVALSAVYSVACIELRANIFVAGLATNLFAAGMIPFLSETFFGTRGVVRIAHDSSRIAGDPAIRTAVFALGSIAIAAAVAAILFRTPLGMRIRAAGGNPDALAVRGVSPSRYRRITMLASGAFAGIAGAEIATRLGVYVPNISAGRGWIALVAIFLGARNPIGVVAASVVFAGFEVLSGAAQGFTNVPGTLLLGVPFLVTLAAMIVYSIFGRRTRIQGQPSPNE
ncbi:MAG: ABC transporter permease [Spirochaetaceae bacterium]|nr:MAG: ABC transporter permease [Spirochaetaceae bacterium]